MSRLGYEFILGSLTTLFLVVIFGLMYPSQNSMHTLFTNLKITDVLVAIFTGLLVLVGLTQAHRLRETVEATRIAADAADLSSRAALNVELPFITAQHPELVQLDQLVPTDGPIAGTVVTLIPGRYSTVESITFFNSGRSAAYPSSLRVGWKLTKLLPNIPDYLWYSPIDRGARIDVKDARSFETPRHTIELSHDDIDALIGNRVDLWFFASLGYYDFMETFHQAMFCWRWGCPSGVGEHYFASDGHPPAEYTKKT
jgi:hypothetical protein